MRSARAWLLRLAGVFGGARRDRELADQQMIDRLSLLPDVDAVAAVSHFPFSSFNANAVFDIPGRPAAAPGEQPSAEFRSTTTGYFRAMGIPLVRGRDFTASDPITLASVAAPRGLFRRHDDSRAAGRRRRPYGDAAARITEVPKFRGPKRRPPRRCGYGTLVALTSNAYATS